MNNNTSLPVEILDAIVEDLISQYRFRDQPRSFLVPLLSVCKLWHMVSEKHLYRHISFGTYYSPQGAVIGVGCEVAKDLLATLETSTRLAALVQGLQVGIEDVPDRKRKSQEWTQAVTRIIHLCPNVEHVDIREFDNAQQDALVSVLKAKSALQFFQIRRSHLPSAVRGSLPLFQLMQCWPKIRSVYVYNFDRLTELDPSSLGNGNSGEMPYCPELQELTLVDVDLRKSDFRSLHMLSNRLPKLALYTIFLHRTGTASDFQPLFGGLRAWSDNLKHLKLTLRHSFAPYHLLSETMSTLKALRELDYCGPPFDFGCIATLPHLQTLSFHTAGYEHKDEINICSNLEDPEKFPALQHIKYTGINRPLYNQLLNSCLERHTNGLNGDRKGREGEMWSPISISSRFFD